MGFSTRLGARTAFLEGGSCSRALPPRWIALLALGALCLAPAESSAQPIFYVFADDTTIPFHPETGVATAEVDISISEDPASPSYPTATQSGFSLLFGIDPLLLTITEVVPTGPYATICGEAWDFFDIEANPSGCPGAVSVAAIFGFTCDAFPTYEVPIPVVRATLEGVPAALIGATQVIDTVLVSFAGCGSPPVGNALFVDGAEVQATWLDSDITLAPTPLVAFVRGDCSGDGLVDVADAVAILLAVFAGVGLDDCPAACEVHDDGASPDISDAVYLLAHLFGGGPDPAPPYPFCGGTIDQSPDDCLFAPACP